MSLEFDEIQLPEEESEAEEASSSICTISPPESPLGRLQRARRRRRRLSFHSDYRNARFWVGWWPLNDKPLPKGVYQPVKATPQPSAHVFKTSEALETSCCDCTKIIDSLVYKDPWCQLCGLMDTTNAKRELRTMHKQILRKPWRAPHKRNRNKLFWSALAHKKRDKQQKRARRKERKYKAFKLNGKLPQRHTYALFQ